MRYRLLCTSAIALLLTAPVLAPGAEPVVSAGFTVRGSGGKPLQGVKVYLYESRNVRRPADFISPATTADGRTAIRLPAGKYWGVARLKMDGNYGPLMPGDKHSGDPLELEVLPTGGSETEFVVTDIREAGQKRRTEQTDTRVVSGRVTTPSGVPVQGAWVYGHRSKNVDEMPDYVSAWTDRDGRYQLHVTASGQVFIGAARSFPPNGRLVPVAVSSKESGGVDIVLDGE